jgi:hypothetical protein
MVPILNPTNSVYATILLFHLRLFPPSSQLLPGKLKGYHKLGFCSTLRQECKTALILEEVLLFSNWLLTSQTEVFVLQSSDFRKVKHEHIFKKYHN